MFWSCPWPPPPRTLHTRLHGPSLTDTVSFSCALSNVKKVSLELGGKSPLIIFADCDLSKAVQMVRTGLWGEGANRE